MINAADLINYTNKKNEEEKIKILRELKKHKHIIYKNSLPF